MTTEKPQLSAEEIERLRRRWDELDGAIVQRKLYHAFQILCDMALTTASRPAGEGEVEGLIDKAMRVYLSVSYSPDEKHQPPPESHHPDRVRRNLNGSDGKAFSAAVEAVVTPLTTALARQQAEIGLWQARHDAAKRGVSDLQAEIASLRGCLSGARATAKAALADYTTERAARENAEGRVAELEELFDKDTKLLTRSCRREEATE